MSQFVHRISIHLNPSKSFVNPVVPMNPMVNSNLCPVSLWLRCSDLRHTPRGWATSRVPEHQFHFRRISIGSLDIIASLPLFCFPISSWWHLRWLKKMIRNKSWIFRKRPRCVDVLITSIRTSSHINPHLGPAWLCQSPARRTSVAHRIPGTKPTFCRSHHKGMGQFPWRFPGYQVGLEQCVSNVRAGFSTSP